MTGIPGRSIVAGAVARLRSLWRGVRGGSAVDADMRDEFAHHVALRTEHLLREGLAPREASRRAHVEFGHVETHRRRGRRARGLGPFDQIGFSWIDVKLGVRMLTKTPALTIVSVFTLAVGIPAGLAPMHVAKAVEVSLPEDAHDRVRALRYQDPVTGRYEVGTYYDFDLWRREAGGFASLGAVRASAYNVASDDGRAEPVAGAEITGSAFEILGTPPLLGRTLHQADEAVGAPSVVLIGYDLWRSRFGADRDIVGKAVRIGKVEHTIVGVMPEDFLFPARQKMWVPMPVEASPQPGHGLGLQVFGTLAEGVSEDRAEAEVSALQQRLAPTLAEERARLRPEVVRFGIAQIGLPGGLELMPEFYGFRILALVLLLVACSNVAMLVFARTATRFRELAVRTALGASRARIVSQIFVETMVLSLLAAGLGIVVIDQLLAYAQGVVLARGFQLPYWLTLRLTGETVWRALLLAVVSATVAGVVPALRVTGRKIQDNIRRADAGRSGIRFGGVTGVLIVLDVAIAVIVVAFVAALTDRLADVRATDTLVGIPAKEYLTAEVRMPVDALRADDGGFDAEVAAQRVAAVQLRIVERLEADPRVRAVAVASVLPRMDHQVRRIEVDEGVGEAGAQATPRSRIARVDVDYLRKLNQRILTGRDFTRSDATADEQPVIVNTVFADRMFGGRNPVGRRLRFVTTESGETGPWHEIVGMIGHLGVNTINPKGDAGVYIPAAPGTIHPMRLAIHLGDSPATFITRLRQIAAEVDPTAVVGNPVVLSTIHQGDWYLMVAVGGGLFLLVIVLIALASSGLYAIMSFAVSERTREIGIRTALGAGSRSIVITILRRSLAQIGIGALLGIPVAGRLFVELRQDAGLGESVLPALLAALALGTGVVLAIGLLSCVVPARRALRIRPAEALNAEA